ncbi:Peptide deformylase [invertebrate metagenome]|uniref:Peptide deformylase n=1 Tax=invertebrate metagenome TaxID=1711999 RepID=A0A2H9T898_9ZZZZ
MAILDILEYPDPRLRQVAKPVEVVDERIRGIVDDMLETMYSAKGVGLAATQVDIHLRLFVMDTSEDESSPIVLINPTYEPMTEDQSVHQEGCLSVPGVYENLAQRYDRIQVRALGRDGQEFTMEMDGLAAVCVQHETDHLDGKLFVDYLSRLKQDRIRKKLKKSQRLRA